MKIIGQNKNSTTVIVTMSEHEWSELQKANGIPYDKRSCDGGASAEIKPISNMMECFFDIKSFRKEIGAVQSKWEKIATVIDTALEK